MTTDLRHFAPALILVLAPACDQAQAPTGDELAGDSELDGEATATGKADGVADNFTYFQIAPDYRRCIAPLCGGYWVSRVNRDSTRCVDGTWAERCYVADLDFAPAGLSVRQIDEVRGQIGAGRALLRGQIDAATWEHFGELGRLSVNEAWLGASDNEPEGLFVRVKDSGIRCFAAPCFNTLFEGKLNSILGSYLSELDLSWTDLDEDTLVRAHEQVYTDDGLIVAGYRYYYRDHGWQKGRVAVQYYQRMTPDPVSEPCERAGCSGQYCVEPDQGDIVTTCEWLPIYACYQDAICERQSSGKCDFTPTDELQACLDDAGATQL